MKDSQTETTLTSSSFLGNSIINNNNKTNTSLISLSTCPYMTAQPLVGIGNSTSFLLKCFITESISSYLINYFYISPENGNKVSIVSGLQTSIYSYTIPFTVSSSSDVIYADFICEIISTSGNQYSSVQVKLISEEGYSNNNDIKFSFDDKESFVDDIITSDDELMYISKTLGSYGEVTNPFLPRTSVRRNKIISSASSSVSSTYELVLNDSLCSENVCLNNSNCISVLQFSSCICTIPDTLDYYNTYINTGDYTILNDYNGIHCQLKKDSVKFLLKNYNYLLKNITNILDYESTLSKTIPITAFDFFSQQLNSTILLKSTALILPFSYQRSAALMYIIKSTTQTIENSRYFNNVFILLDFLYTNSYESIANFPDIFFNIIDYLQNFFINSSNIKRVISKIQSNDNKDIASSNYDEFRFNEITNTYDYNYYYNLSSNIINLIENTVSCVTSGFQNNITKNDYYTSGDVIYSINNILSSLFFNFTYVNFEIIVKPVYENTKLDEFFNTYALSEYKSWIDISDMLIEYFTARYNIEYQRYNKTTENFYYVNEDWKVIDDTNKNSSNKEIRLVSPKITQLNRINNSISSYSNSDFNLASSINSRLLKEISENKNQNYRNTSKTRNLQDSTSDTPTSTESSYLNINFLIWYIQINYYSTPLFHSAKLNQNISSYKTESYLAKPTGEKVEIDNTNNQIDQYFRVYSNNDSFIDYLKENITKFYDTNTIGSESDLTTMPKFIFENGSVWDLSLEARIEEYHNYYNVSCAYYSLDTKIESSTGVYYNNYTEDLFFKCSSTHLSLFSVIFNYLEINTSLQSRFYFLKYTRLLKCSCNYTSNYCFFISFGTTMILVIVLIGFYCLDLYEEDRDVIISSMKKSIIRERFKYFTEDEVDKKYKELTKILPVSFLSNNFEIKDDVLDNKIKKSLEKDKNMKSSKSVRTVKTNKSSKSNKTINDKVSSVSVIDKLSKSSKVNKSKDVYYNYNTNNIDFDELKNENLNDNVDDLEDNNRDDSEGNKNREDLLLFDENRDNKESNENLKMNNFTTNADTKQNFPKISKSIQ